ncbi:MAG TPA: lysylphosphatidylglycerol synthase transmembrane domain-containing protein [Candidatus Binatia bacterium]|nr:lysylphosphatidylglycerol synthase transmembrane domain-containing protein [Candidatus Binatia bacterium]
MNAFARRDDNGKKRIRTIAAVILPLAVSALLVWLLLRGLSWQRILGSILSASPFGLALYGVLALAGLWFRAVRFRILLSEPKPAAGPVFLTTVVQNALGDLVPARLASLGSYVWLMKKRLAVAADSAASTFIVSFVLDLVTLGPLLLLAVAVRFGMAAPPGDTWLSLKWAAGFGLIFFAASAAAAWWIGPLTRIFARLPRVMARGRETSGWAKVAAFLERVAASMEIVHRGGALLRLFAVSLLIRLIKYGSLFALTESLLVETGFAAPHPSPWDLIIGVSATELVASLPIPAIGQFGVWEGGMVGVLVMMGFPREQATLVAFGVHGITTAFEYLAALLAFGGLFVLAKKRRETP